MTFNNNYQLATIAHARRDALMQEAEQDRLAQQAMGRNEAHGAARIVINRLLVSFGQKLQGEQETAVPARQPFEAR